MARSAIRPEGPFAAMIRTRPGYLPAHRALPFRLRGTSLTIPLPCDSPLIKERGLLRT